MSNNLIGLNEINIDDVIFEDLERDIDIGCIYCAYIKETDNLDKALNIYTKDNHNDIFQTNYYGTLNNNEFKLSASITVFDKEALYNDYPDIADNVINIAESENIFYVNLDDNIKAQLTDKFNKYINTELEYSEEERDDF